MTTATTIVTDALGLIGVVDPVEAAQAEDADLSLRVLNRIIDGLGVVGSMAFASSFQTFTLPAGTSSRTIGTAGDWAVERPVSIGIGAYAVQNTIATKLEQWTAQEYTAITLKDATSDVPEGFHYQTTTAALGTLYFWPVPASDVSVVLPLVTRLSSFADLTTDYTLADGYETLFVYELAIKLAPHYNREAPASVIAEATRIRRQIQRVNRKVPVLSVQEMRMLGDYHSEL